jgi:hypothetical protein
VTAKGQQRGPPPISQEAKKANANEALGQDVPQEPPQEFVSRESHLPLAVPMGIVFPAEGDLTVLEGEQAMVGDGNTMGVTRQVVKDVFRPAEGWFGVNDPVLTKQGAKQSTELLGILEDFWVSVESECALKEGSAEAGHKLPPKDAAEGLDGQEEGVAILKPAGVISRQAASGNHTVDVGMVLQVLSPGVEHAEEADLGAEVTRIDSDFEERRGAGLEEQAVKEALVLIGERRQLVGEREDYMNVRNGQEFLAALRQPAVARPGLTLGAGAVATRVVRDGAMTTAKAAIPVAAQSGGAATLDGIEHLPLGPSQPGPAPFDEAFALGANDIGHLEGGPNHFFLCRRREW